MSSSYACCVRLSGAKENKSLPTVALSVFAGALFVCLCERCAFNGFLTKTDECPFHSSSSQGSRHCLEEVSWRRDGVGES